MTDWNNFDLLEGLLKISWKDIQVDIDLDKIDEMGQQSFTLMIEVKVPRELGQLRYPPEIMPTKSQERPPK